MTAPQPAPAQAAAFILAASALIGGMQLLAKMLGTDTLGPALHPLQVSHGRFVFALAIILPVAAALRLRIGKVHWGTHAARSFAGWSGVTLMFAAAALIPLSDATAISFLNPIFAMVFAIFLLGERVGPWRWLAAAIGFGGAIVLLRPGPGSFAPAALLALGSAVLFGVEITIIKRLTSLEPPLQLLLINNLIGLVISSIAVIWIWQAPTAAQWLGLAGIGLLIAGAQTCYIQALRRAEASFIAPFSYAALVFAALFDGIVFGTVPDAISVIGAAVILAGGGLLAWREGRIRA